MGGSETFTSTVKTDLSFAGAGSLIRTTVLEGAIRRAFPEFDPSFVSFDLKILQRIADATGRPVDEVYGILLADKQAENELGAPVSIVDPNAFSLPTDISFPASATEYFLPLSVCKYSVTLVCHMPFLKLSNEAFEAIAEAAEVTRVDIVYTTPALFDSARATFLDAKRMPRDRAMASRESDFSKESPRPYLNLDGFHPEPSLSLLVPPGVQRRYKIVPIYLFAAQYLTLASERDLDVIRRSEIRSHLRELLEINYVVADSKSISTIIAGNELAAMESTSLAGRLSKETEDRAEELEVVHVDAATIGERANRDDASIIPLLDAFLAFAIKHKASDLHIAPFDTHLAVEVRIDDWKHPYPETIPVKLTAPILSRIKYLSNIDIQRLVDPLYGRFTIRLANVGDIEVRTTIMPTVHGDSATLRFALKGARINTLEENGMNPHEIEIIRRVVEGASGLLLVVGPTGSGKSTTLYSILGSIDANQWEVLSAEEPPERYLEGVKQTDITRGVSYASFLAGALRADPDYINIGETRTPDTAAQLLRAVETGHICFSTLHTSQASGAPGRMFGLEVTPYALADALSAVIAQTLVAKVCPKCSYEVAPPSDAELEALGITPQWFGPNPIFLEGRGCPHCMMRGFRGRMLIAEGYCVDSHIRRLILNRASSDEIRKSQEAQGGKTMLQQACKAAGAGRVPVSKALALGWVGKE